MMKIGIFFCGLMGFILNTSTLSATSKPILYGNTVRFRHASSGRFITGLGISYSPHKDSPLAIVANHLKVGGQQPTHLQFIIRPTEGSKMGTPVRHNEPFFLELMAFTGVMYYDANPHIDGEYVINYYKTLYNGPVRICTKQTNSAQFNSAYAEWKVEGNPSLPILDQETVQLVHNSNRYKVIPEPNLYLFGNSEHRALSLVSSPSAADGNWVIEKVE